MFWGEKRTTVNSPTIHFSHHILPPPLLISSMKQTPFSLRNTTIRRTPLAQCHRLDVPRIPVIPSHPHTTQWQKASFNMSSSLPVLGQFLQRGRPKTIPVHVFLSSGEQLGLSHNGTLHVAPSQKRPPVFVSLERIRVPNNDNSASCARDGHVETTPIRQETYPSVVVGPHGGQNDHL